MCKDSAYERDLGFKPLPLSQLKKIKKNTNIRLKVQLYIGIKMKQFSFWINNNLKLVYDWTTQITDVEPIEFTCYKG